MKVKNTVFFFIYNVIVHAQTGLDQVIDKKSGIPLDVLFNETELKSRFYSERIKLHVWYLRDGYWELTLKYNISHPTCIVEISW